MDWLESLLWDPASVAHIVCLYAFVISVGVLLGKIKIFGISLGVTFDTPDGSRPQRSRRSHTGCCSMEP